MERKQTFKMVFAATAILLAILPGLVTFSAVLTGLFNKMEWYVWLQEFVVPFESRLVAVIIKSVGITAQVNPNSEYSMVLLKGVNEVIPIKLEWNCLGWQSLIMLGLTLLTGLRGDYKFISKMETVLIGVLGTFLVNLLRMAAITGLAYYVSSLSAFIIHDYLAAFVTLCWLIFFWWFSYSFVLEEKN